MCRNLNLTQTWTVTDPEPTSFVKYLLPIVKLKQNCNKLTESNSR